MRLQDKSGGAFHSSEKRLSHMASRVDIDEAFMVGGAAVKAADEGDTARW